MSDADELDRDAELTEPLPAALDGERLDRVVALLTGWTRAAAASAVSAGGATIDGRVVTVGKTRLTAGQIVGIDRSMAPRPRLPAADAGVPVEVVHADADVIVVDKAAGLVVHPGAGNEDRTLVNGLLARFPELAGVGEAHRPGIVHRLDAGTSGLLAVARTADAYHALVEALAERRVRRVYRAVVWGSPEHPSGVIDAPIGRDLRDPQKMRVAVDGKPARTHFHVLAGHHTPEVTEVEFRLETGRTHQIRVHAAAIGHPVVGDVVYGKGRPTLGLERPFLHAAELAFDHPRSGEPLRFTSALPADLARVLTHLDRAD